MSSSSGPAWRDCALRSPCARVATTTSSSSSARRSTCRTTGPRCPRRCWPQRCTTRRWPFRCALPWARSTGGSAAGPRDSTGTGAQSPSTTAKCWSSTGWWWPPASVHGASTCPARRPTRQRVAMSCGRWMTRPDCATSSSREPGSSCSGPASSAARSLPRPADSAATSSVWRSTPSRWCVRWVLLWARRCSVGTRSRACGSGSAWGSSGTPATTESRVWSSPTARPCGPMWSSRRSAATATPSGWRARGMTSRTGSLCDNVLRVVRRGRCRGGRSPRRR